jgi:hypothetical protein
VLRDAEGPGGWVSAVAFAGVIVFAAGVIVSGTIHLELADYADNTETIDPAAIQALNVFEFNFNFFMFFAGFVLVPLWILIVSIIGISRARAEGAAPPAT